MVDSKLHINSTISNAKGGARYLGLDIKNYFLGTALKYFQYMRVLPSSIRQEIWDDPRYSIFIAADRYVYLQIRRGMYGLKEVAAIIAFNQLVKKLAPAGYKPTPFTPGLWRHRTKRTTFALCVDNFGVKYFSHADALHLITTLTAHYELTIDWTGSLYSCSLTLPWNCAQGYVDISMPGEKYCTRMNTACDCRLDAVVVTLMLLLGSTAFSRRRKYCRLIKRYRSLSVDRELYPIGKDTLADYKCNIKHYL
jgi:hypothetical protein